MFEVNIKRHDVWKDGKQNGLVLCVDDKKGNFLFCLPIISITELRPVVILRQAFSRLVTHSYNNETKDLIRDLSPM